MTRTYTCDCGAEIEIPEGDGVPVPKLGYHWREQCSSPPTAYADTGGANE